MKHFFSIMILSVFYLLQQMGEGMAMNAHDFDFESIDGSPLPMSDYSGSVVLLVNTASFCGFTPQYAALQALWRDYQD